MALVLWLTSRALRPHRRAATVSSRRAWNTGGWSVSRVQRQRQLHSARPGTLMRASLPRLRTSWNGAMAQRRWRRPHQGHQSRGDVPALAGGPSQSSRRAGDPRAADRRTSRASCRRRKYAGQRGQQEAAAVHLLDDLIRPRQQRGRDREAERLGGFEVDDQLKFRGVLDR